jgi:hypothetical protein
VCVCVLLRSGFFLPRDGGVTRANNKMAAVAVSREDVVIFCGERGVLGYVRHYVVLRDVRVLTWIVHGCGWYRCNIQVSSRASACVWNKWRRRSRERGCVRLDRSNT